MFGFLILQASSNRSISIYFKTGSLPPLGFFGLVLFGGLLLKSCLKKPFPLLESPTWIGKTVRCFGWVRNTWNYEYKIPGKTFFKKNKLCELFGLVKEQQGKFVIFKIWWRREKKWNTKFPWAHSTGSYSAGAWIRENENVLKVMLLHHTL